jgi:hypothetical protein
MKKTSWITKCDDGIKREVRVELSHKNIKWQFKRKDEEQWDYDSKPTSEDWDMLEDILERRAKRGKGGNILESVRKLRSQSRA